MTSPNIAFRVIDWSAVAPIEHPGETGMAWWQTIEYQGLRMRIVEYSAGYLADHWCRKGHIVHCLVGEFVSELDDGQAFALKAGMSYVVSDDVGAHRSFTEYGVKLMIIDGEFLAPT